MRSCLRTAVELDPNVYSLRDPDNLPHATPAVYRVEPEDDLSEVPERYASIEFIRAGRALFLVDARSVDGLKPERKDQLATYALNGDPASWDRFPISSKDRMLAILPFFNLSASQALAIRRATARLL